MKRWFAAPGLALAAAAALACGVCDEDRIAATYDHAAAQRAAAQGKVVVYCGVTGVRDVQRVKRLARGLRGVAADSVRVSAAPAAISFTLDAKGASPQEAVLALQSRLAPGEKVVLLRAA